MIIIVAGLPGSGKGLLAARLASKCEAEYISSEKVRQELKSDGRYSSADKLQVYKELLKQAAVILDQRRNVVVGATFYHHTMRELFLRLAHTYNVRLRMIEVTADESLIEERLKEPRKRSDADYDAYETIRDAFEEITMPHLVLQSTGENIDEMIDASMSYIGEPAVKSRVGLPT